MIGQSIILTSDNGTVTLGAYSIRHEDCEFERQLHYSPVKGAYAEDILGYRNVYTIDFLPFNGDKASLYMLYGFIISGNRTIDYGDGAIAVTLDPVEVVVDFMESTKFGDAFSSCAIKSLAPPKLSFDERAKSKASRHFVS